MKLCPSCGEPYDDELLFCELDGTPLVAGRQAVEDESQSSPVSGPTAPGAQRGGDWVTLSLGLALGILVCTATFALYLLGRGEGGPATRPDLLKAADRKATAAPPPPRPTPYEPSPSPSPTPEETPTPAATPAPTPAPTPRQPEDGLETLSDSPASVGDTSGRGEHRVAIHLNDGATFLAEDAWRAAGGVWYRQGGVVALLERSRIRSVERQPAPKPSPPS